MVEKTTSWLRSSKHPSSDDAKPTGSKIVRKIETYYDACPVCALARAACVTPLAILTMA